MKPQYAEILQLRAMGYTEAEIARLLGMPLHAVKYACEKIREFAMTCFGDLGEAVFS